MKKVLLFIFICSALFAQTPIFIMHSYHEAYEWTYSQQLGFKTVLDNTEDFYPLYSTEYLDTKRRDLDAEYEKELVHYMRSKYQGYHPKLIYVTDDDALNFMLKHKEEFFPSVPVVFSGINDLSKVGNLEEKLFTGIFEKKDIIPNIELIRALFPQEKELLLIGDGSTTAKAIQQDLEEDMATAVGMKVQSIQDQQFEAISTALERYRGKIVVLTTIGGFKSQEGHLIPLKKIIHQIVNTGDFIVIGLEDTYIRQGVIGGRANDGFSEGSSAAKMALDILSHPFSPLPRTSKNTNSWIFDAKALQEHSISLPEEIAKRSIFLNPNETFFQQHQQLLFTLLYGLSSLVVLVGLAFTWYLYRSRKLISLKARTCSAISESLNRAQKIARFGNWEWDIQTNSLWWSDEVYRIFGLNSKEFEPTYEKFLERVHPEDRESVRHAVERALHDKTDYRIVHRLVKANGTVRHALEEGHLSSDDQGNPLKMTGVIQDITEEYEKEEALLLQAQIFDAIQDSIFVHDLEGNFIYLNENAYKTRGYTKEELMGMKLSELDAPEYTSGHPEVMKKMLKQMQEEGLLKLRVEHLCKNGDRLPVEVYAKLITLHDKEYVLSSVRDISEQIVTQRALEESESKYRNLVENAMIGVYRTDLSGTILYANPALSKMLAYDSADEITGLNSLKLYNSPAQREKLVQLLRKEHSLSNYEMNLLDKHNAPVPIMLSATLDENILSGMIIDMRELKKSREEIDKLSKAVEQIDDTVLITDQFGLITYVNEAFCTHTGFSREEVLGKTPRILKSGMHDQSLYKDLWKKILKGEVYRETLINRKKSGELFYEHKTISPLINEEGSIIGFVSSGKDVTAETLMHQEIERIASTDNLTGIYNRHKFEELFALEAERVRRFSVPLSLILIDIDHFKSVNDTYGHDVGDEVLKHLVECIQENVRKIDIFARWGGEEFLVLSPGTDLQQIQLLAEKLRSAVESAVFPVVRHVTISLGVSTFSKESTFSELFKHADQGLYLAKKNGRNRVGISPVEGPA